MTRGWYWFRLSEGGSQKKVPLCNLGGQRDVVRETLGERGGEREWFHGKERERGEPDRKL